MGGKRRKIGFVKERKDEEECKKTRERERERE